jgi:serine/threonine protein kinase/tetratricopeptide (TPR) repeat protein
MSDELAELDRLLDCALALPAAERAAFVARAVPDSERRARLERLLALATAEETFLPHPAALAARLLFPSAAIGGDGAPDAGANAGARIDHYLLVRRLGQGGMGEVWEAEQLEPVRRRVALKLVRPGLANAEVMARFESERQALALMNHANVAQVFDGGAVAGRPYFVMELVKGPPVTDYCDGERLALERRLELFLQVCDGVQHAHHRGIIHRDLKPSNVLVAAEDGRPVPKIIDFGIARATHAPLTEHTFFTAHGQLVGTPEYMSPEQAGGDPADIDTRSDVYSLGVLLYELLTGRRPFGPEVLRQGGFLELLRTVRDVEPQRPSQRVAALGPAAGDVAALRGLDASALVRRLRGDLDWIVARALEKDRERRYGSPAELAADVRRHLADEPVSAGPPSTAYRLLKLARRHRAAFASTAVVTVSLVVGGAIALAQAIRATRAERDARAEAETARQVSEFLIGLFERSDPGIAKGNDPTARELLARGRDQLEGELADQPLIRARLQATVGGILRKLGHYEDARPLIESALAIREAELPTDHPDRARAVIALARLEGEVAHHERAETLFRAGQSALASALGAEHPEALDAVVELAQVVLHRGRYEEAERLYRDAAVALERAVGPEDVLVGHAWSGAANALFRLGRFAEAEQAHRRALGIYERALGSDHPSVALVLGNLTGTLAPLGRYEDAKRTGRRALEIQEKVYGPEHRFVATALTNLATVHGGAGELDEAERLLLRGLEIRRKVFGEDSPETGIDYKNLGHVALLRADYAAAERYLKRSLEIDRARLAPDHPRVGWNLGALGDLALRRGRYDEAEGHLRRAIEITAARLGDSHVEVLRHRRGLARIALARGRPVEAERDAREIVAVFEKANPESPDLPATLEVLARARAAQGGIDEARELLGRALALEEKLTGTDSPALAPLLVAAVESELAGGAIGRAESLARRAVEVAGQRHAAAHPESGSALLALALALDAAGREEEARPLAERAHRVLAGALGEAHPETVRAARAAGKART